MTLKDFHSWMNSWPALTTFMMAHFLQVMIQFTTGWLLRLSSPVFSSCSSWPWLSGSTSNRRPRPISATSWTKPRPSKALWKQVLTGKRRKINKQKRLHFSWFFLSFKASQRTSLVGKNSLISLLNSMIQIRACPLHRCWLFSQANQGCWGSWTNKICHSRHQQNPADCPLLDCISMKLGSKEFFVERMITQDRHRRGQRALPTQRIPRPGEKQRQDSQYPNFLGK